MSLFGFIFYLLCLFCWLYLEKVLNKKKKASQPNWAETQRASPAKPASAQPLLTSLSHSSASAPSPPSLTSWPHLSVARSANRCRPLSLTCGARASERRLPPSTHRRNAFAFMAINGIEAVFNPRHHGVETPVLTSYKKPCSSPTFRPHSHPSHATRPPQHDPRKPPEPYAVEVHCRRTQDAPFSLLRSFSILASWRVSVTSFLLLCVSRLTRASSTFLLRRGSQLRRAIHHAPEHHVLLCFATDTASSRCTPRCTNPPSPSLSFHRNANSGEFTPSELGLSRETVPAT